MRSKDSIDVTNRKPRRFRGTPTFKLRNNVIFAVVTYTLAVGASLMFSPITQDLRNRLQIFGEARQYELEEETDEERLKKSMMFQAYNSVLWKNQIADVSGET